MCQGLGPKKHDEISEIDRKVGAEDCTPELTETKINLTMPLSIHWNFPAKSPKGGRHSSGGATYIYIYIYMYIYIYIYISYLFICLKSKPNFTRFGRFIRFTRFSRWMPNITTCLTLLV